MSATAQEDFPLQLVNFEIAPPDILQQKSALTRKIQLVCEHSIVYHGVPVPSRGGSTLTTMIPFTVPNPISLASLVSYLAQTHCSTTADDKKTIFITDTYTYVPSDQLLFTRLITLNGYAEPDVYTTRASAHKAAKKARKKNHYLMWMKEIVLERSESTLQEGESVLPRNIPSSLKDELRSWQVKLMGPLIITFREYNRQFQPAAFIRLTSPKTILTATFLFVRPSLSINGITIKRYPAVDAARVEAKMKEYCETNKEDIERMLAEQGEDINSWEC